MADPDRLNPLPPEDQEDMAFEMLRGDEPVSPPPRDPPRQPRSPVESDRSSHPPTGVAGAGADAEAGLNPQDDGFYELNVADEESTGTSTPGQARKDYSAEVSVGDAVEAEAPASRGAEGEDADREPVQQKQYVPNPEPKVVDPNTASRKREEARKRAAEELAQEEMGRRRRNRIILLAGVVALAAVLIYMIFLRG